MIRGRGLLFMEKINLKYWKCANTYEPDYGKPPQSSGVYLFLAISFTNRSKKLIYIGQSENLLKRFKNHEKMNKLYNHYDHIYFYWYATHNHIDIEKKLIEKYRPKFNKQYNG